MTTGEEEENVCPNGAAGKTTPVRKGRGQTKGGQKLFSAGAGATKMKGTGERDSMLLKENYNMRMLFIISNCDSNQSKHIFTSEIRRLRMECNQKVAFRPECVYSLQMVEPLKKTLFTHV